MTSPVDLCNRALHRIGANGVISFDDNTTESDLCNSLYQASKKSILRSFPWNCATSRAKLAQKATPPINEWPFAFALPADNLKVLQVYIGDHKAVRQRSYHDPAYQVEGGAIYSWDENVYLKYIKNIDETEMDIHLQEALVAKLASEFAYPLIASINTVDRFRQYSDIMLNEARVTDSIENPHEVFRTDRLSVVRR